MQLAYSRADVERILNRTSVIAETAITGGTLQYVDGVTNELSLFGIIQKACEQEGFLQETAQLVSGHKFPDVIFEEAQIGVEIKGHRLGDRILGNSIMGSTPSLVNPQAIYLLVWNDQAKSVIWRDYFQCVVGAEVTHSPRFVLRPDCSVDESLFGTGAGQIGNASEICLGPDGFKSEVILARMRAKAMSEGNIPWWITPENENGIYAAVEAQQQLSIVKYSSLPVEGARSDLLKTLIIGFPEILGKSGTKYDDALVWSLLRKSVLISRDAFTAGGRVEESIPSICIEKPISLPQVLIRAQRLISSDALVKKVDLEDIWQAPISTSQECLQTLRKRIIESGIANHRESLIHDGCSCSSIQGPELASRLTEWLLAQFKIESIQ